MDFIVEHFKISFEKYATNPKLCDCIHTSWYAFDKYYFKTDEVTTYSAALLLAPYWRKNYITRNWKASQKKPVINTARKLQVTQYKDIYKGKVAIQKAFKHVQEPNAYNI